MKSIIFPLCGLSYGLVEYRLMHTPIWIGQTPIQFFPDVNSILNILSPCKAATFHLNLQHVTLINHISKRESSRHRERSSRDLLRAKNFIEVP